MTASPSVLSLSWIRYHGRSADLAGRVGARAEFISVGRLGQRFAVLWRYPMQFAQTVRVLWRRRPDALIVMAPPLPLVALALAWGLRGSRPVVIDAHSAAVISPRTGRPRRRFAVLARYADLVLVTRAELAAGLANCRVAVLDDPPVDVPDAQPDRSRRAELPLRAVFPCSWYADEPVDDVLAAARLLPGVEVVLTGNPGRPIHDLPANVTLTGYLDLPSYWSLLRGADLVLALTNRDNTMQRAGYEALAAGLPLVVSDTNALRDWYGAAAVAAARGGDALAVAITTALTRRSELIEHGDALRTHRSAQFAAGLRVLRATLGLDAELTQQRHETVVPAVVPDDQAMRVGSKLLSPVSVGEQPGQGVGELLGGVSADVVAFGHRIDAADAKGRGHNSYTGAESVEHLEPATATAVDRHDHHGARSPRSSQVIDEAERTHAFGPRRASAAHDLQLDERRRSG